MNHIENTMFSFIHTYTRITGHSGRCSHVERIINYSVSTCSHSSTNAQPTEFNTCTVTCTHPPHTHTSTNSCSIDNITYFLPTVIWLRNCRQSVSPGNSWTSRALFSTLNKDSALIGAAPPLSLFSHQSDFFVCVYGHNVHSSGVVGEVDESA